MNLIEHSRGFHPIGQPEPLDSEYSSNTGSSFVHRKRRSSPTDGHQQGWKRSKGGKNVINPYEASLHAGVPPHHLGVRPLGNIYGSSKNIKANVGSFSQLPDELLILLLEYLEASSLQTLGRTCKALYAFTSLDDLWKTLAIERFSSPTWRGTWRATYLNLPAAHQASLSCHGLYSDVLYRPHHCAHIPLSHYVSSIPARNSITRLPDLSAEEYNEKWTNRPFILTAPIKRWPVYAWTLSSLLASHSQTPFQAEAVTWPLSTYASYASSTHDESPLYLFDHGFAEKMSLRDSSFPVPSAFTPDLFGALGAARPHHRWLIVGPPRSGSTFHKDPNGTNAWNAVLRGRKYWMLLPPPKEGDRGSLPGLHISPDGAHITAPLSIAEYLLTFHNEARRYPGAVEAVCERGEVLHVPGGWFHMVVNLDDGENVDDEDENGNVNIAITQNFVPRAKLPEVLRFLRDQRESVSGFRYEDGGVGEGEEYETFVDRLRQEFPNELDEALAALEGEDARRRGTWEVVTGRGEEEAGAGAQAKVGFTFGFGFDEADEDEI